MLSKYGIILYKTENMQISCVIRRIFLLVLLFILPEHVVRLLLDQKLICYSLATNKDRQQGHSLPVQEYKGIDRPPCRVADMRTQGQQVRTLLQGKRRPNKPRSATIGPTSTVYYTHCCANNCKQCSDYIKGKKDTDIQLQGWRSP